MGKAQSKRSVDITTDTKKAVDEEITEKVEKIEDTDHEAVSATINEQPDKNHLKKEELPANIDKEIVVENNVEPHAGGGDSVVNQSENKSETVATCKENDAVNDDDASAAAATAAAAAVVEDTSKKTKKEKVKKKWSFRSISFGRKDKQKPSKNEEVEDNSPTGSSNGNAADGKSSNPQNESHGIDQLVKVEEDMEKQVGNHEDSDKKTGDDKTTSPTTTPTLKTEEQLPEQQQTLQQNIIKDSSQTNCNVVKENDSNVNVPNEIITEPEIDVTEAAMTEKKTEYVSAQNSLPPIKDECKMMNAAVDIDMSLAKNSINGFTTDNVSSVQTNNCQNVDTVTKLMDNDNMNGDVDGQDDKELKNNKAAIPFKNISECTTTVNNSDNNSCEIITEQNKPQIEVNTPDASTISATVGNLSIASNLQSKNTQEHYHSYQDHNTAINSLQSNDITLDDVNHDNVPDSIAAVVVDIKQAIDIDTDNANENVYENENPNQNQYENENLHTLPPPPPLPPIPTSPPPPLNSTDYSIEEQDVISFDNNYDNEFSQNTNDDSINRQHEINESDKINDVILMENQILPTDHHHSNEDDQISNNECTEEQQQISVITNEISYDNDNIVNDIAQVSNVQNYDEQKPNEEISEYGNVNGTEYNEYNCTNNSMECGNDSNIIAQNVIDELTENAIKIVDQQNVIICCNKLLENNAITTTAATTTATTIILHGDHNDDSVVVDNDDNVAILMKDIAVKNQSTNITDINYLNKSKDECLMQLNGVNTEEKEIEQQQQLIEQFERKMCLITETGNVADEHGNLVESL